MSHLEGMAQDRHPAAQPFRTQTQNDKVCCVDKRNSVMLHYCLQEVPL